MIRESLGLGPEYGTIFTFVDFGNVTKWFIDDRQDTDNRPLADDQFVRMDLEKLSTFLRAFSKDVRFYYGHDSQRPSSLAFLSKTKHVFGKNRVFTKPIQWVRHHITAEEAATSTRSLFNDADGIYIKLPKCNFDVEISVDATKMLEKYDTFCLLSGDADFTYLNTYLRSRGKKIILLKSGHITAQLRASTDLVISASDIKRHIVRIESKNLAQGQVSADDKPGYPGQVRRV
jgi:uncharacterized LabA/DUF88 family protein